MEFLSIFPPVLWLSVAQMPRINYLKRKFSSEGHNLFFFPVLIGVKIGNLEREEICRTREGKTAKQNATTEGLQSGGS